MVSARRHPPACRPKQKVLKGLFLMKPFKIIVVIITTIIVNFTTKERSIHHCIALKNISFE